MLCMGVLIEGKRLSFAHNYFDGKMHDFNSDGICPNCLRIRSEYKKNKGLNINVRKEEPKTVFTEEDINKLEKLTLEMYSPNKWQ